MTAQEQQMLQGLTERINQTQLPQKDMDAEQYLQQELGRNPDAMYILAQTVLVQQYALEQAKKQMGQLQDQLQQAQQPKHATSFLGTLLGRSDPPPPPPAPQQSGGQYIPVPNANQGYGQGGYASYPPPPPPSAYGSPLGYGSPVGYGAPQSGGFLRSALQTATGVAAGALAFEGIESLMHGFGHAAGYGGGFEPGFGGGFDGGSPREEIVNNYYGDASGEHSDRGGSESRGDTSVKDDDGYAAGTDNSPDMGGYGDDASSFDDGSSSSGDFDTGGDDNSNF